MISETESLPKLRRYGIPYKGSKNNIAEWVYKHFPKQTNFYDLFAGGCAITQIALMKGHFQRYFANDLDFDGITLFMEAVHGRFRNETRWISREDFKALYEKDPYVKYCWSFGNNGLQYLYSEEIEPYKRACHYAIVFDDWKELERLCPEIINEAKQALKGVSNIQQRRLNFGPSVVKKLKKIGDWNVVVNNPLYMSCHWRGGKLDGKQNDLQSLQSLQSLERLESLERLQRLERLSVSNKSYDEVEILPHSVLYCDIPYYNTDEYAAGGFDHQKFYKWALQQKELVVISEYYMPDDFMCIDAIEKSVTLCSGGDVKAVEKLFIPRKQAELYKKLLNKKR